jgi:hypothetical protein
MPVEPAGRRRYFVLEESLTTSGDRASIMRGAA